MPYCPSCKYEYVPGIKTCPDCNIDLVDVLPEEKKSVYIDTELICVASYPYAIDAHETRIKLQLNGVESVVNERMDVSGGMAVADAGVRVFVRKEDVDKANEILKSE